MKDLTNTIFGEYRLLHCLGYGDTTSVYLGEHTYSKALFAIKMLQLQLSPQDVEDFVNEAHLIMRFKHPNIVAAYAYGIEDGIPFFVMDRAPNGTLRQRYPVGTRLSNAEIARYVTQVADALQYIHDQEHLVHCDVKSGNMFLGPNDEVLLGDFGSALVMSASPSMRDEIAGTLEFMAPEQIQGEPCFATDQYALAVVVYEWLCGTCPFTGSVEEIPSQHLYDPPPPLCARVPGLSPAIEAVVFRALAKDPQQRYPSVRAFADALLAVLEPISYPAATPGSFKLIKRSLPPRPEQPTPVLQLPAPTVEVIPLAAASPALPKSTGQLEEAKVSNQEQTLQLKPTNQKKALPLKPKEQVEKTKASDQHAETPPAVAAASAAQVATKASKPASVPATEHRMSRRIAILGLAGLAFALGGDVVAVVRVLHPDARKVPRITLHANKPGSLSAPREQVHLMPPPYIYRGHHQAVKGVSWLTNQYIVSCSLDDTVHIWNSITGATKFVYTQHTVGVKAVAAIPEGVFIASGDSVGAIHVWNARSGIDRFAPLAGGLASAIRSLAWSPDDRFLASASDDSIVSIWDTLLGLRLFAYAGHSGPVLGVAWSPDGRFLASASDDHTVQVWSAIAREQQALLTYRGHTQRAWGVTWSPDGRRIASASQDGTVQVWNATTGTLLARHMVAAGRAETVAWSPNGRLIASGSDDGTVQVWSATTGRLVSNYHQQHSTIWSLAWSPDGQHLAAASSDGTVLVWQIDPHLT